MKLNGLTVWQSAWADTSYPCLRGVTIIVVNPFNCSVQEPARRFDTYNSTSADNSMCKYLQEIRKGSIVVGVTADEPTIKLRNALSALSDLGVNVSDVQSEVHSHLSPRKASRPRPCFVRCLLRQTVYISSRSSPSPSQVNTGSVLLPINIVRYIFKISTGNIIFTY